MSPKFIKRLSLVGFVLLGIFALFSFTSLVQTNGAERYEVKQAAISGDLSIRTEPGMYMQNFGSITPYDFAGDYHFNIENVLFRDGSTATIRGTVKYKLPITNEGRIRLHRELRSFQAVKNDLVENAVQGAINQTAKLFGAEEVYSTDSAEFIEIFKGQLDDGIYRTVRAGNVNKVVRNEDGTPQIAKRSVLTEYGINVINVDIVSLDFDEATDALIQSRKEAEQQETLARAEAERAKQDAITVEERGKATVAKVKYEALAVKEKAVIEAEKQTAIETEKTLQALEYAKQVEASKKAEAAGNQALVAAGLTPLEQATIEKETAIGVAQAMSGVKFPEVMVISGENGKSQALNPFDAVGLKSFKDIGAEIATKSKASE